MAMKCKSNSHRCNCNQNADQTGNHNISEILLSHKEEDIADCHCRTEEPCNNGIIKVCRQGQSETHGKTNQRIPGLLLFFPFLHFFIPQFEKLKSEPDTRQNKNHTKLLGQSAGKTRKGPLHKKVAYGIEKRTNVCNVFYLAGKAQKIQQCKMNAHHLHKSKQGQNNIGVKSKDTFWFKDGFTPGKTGRFKET